MAGKKILLEARDLVKEFALEGGKKERMWCTRYPA